MSTIFRASHPNEPMVPIGRVEVTEGFQITNRGFQNASWWQTLDCQPQTVTLFSNGYNVVYTVKGTVVDANFASTYGGMPIGGYDKSRDIGGEATYTFTYYAYMFAEQRMKGELPSDRLFHMFHEYGVGCAPYQHDPSKTGYFMVMPNIGHPLQLERTNGSGFDAEHTYAVIFRDKLQADVTVKRSEGFNGDTRQVAIKRATEALVASNLI
jgi:hypothetical protein